MTSPNMMIDKGPGGYMLKVLPSASSTMSYSDWAFGFEISGSTVTVNAGKVRHGTRTAVSVAETPVEIAADNTWVYVEYTYGAGAIITSSTTEPTDTEDGVYLVIEDGAGVDRQGTLERAPQGEGRQAMTDASETRPQGRR